MLQRVELERRLHVDTCLVEQFDELVDEADRLRRAHHDQGVVLRIDVDPDPVGVEDRLDPFVVDQERHREVTHTLRLATAAAVGRVGLEHLPHALCRAIGGDRLQRVDLHHHLLDHRRLGERRDQVTDDLEVVLVARDDQRVVCLVSDHRHAATQVAATPTGRRHGAD